MSSLWDTSDKVTIEKKGSGCPIRQGRTRKGEYVNLTGTSAINAAHEALLKRGDEIIEKIEAIRATSSVFGRVPRGAAEVKKWETELKKAEKMLEQLSKAAIKNFESLRKEAAKATHNFTMTIGQIPQKSVGRKS